MMAEYLSDAKLHSEEYWRRLVDEGEHSLQSAPPAVAEAIWLGLGIAVDNPAAELDPPLLDEDWEIPIKAMDDAVELKLSVVGCNRGGLLVEWDGRQGFVPVSHLVDFPSYLDERQREQELYSRVGQVLCLRVIEVDPERKRLVLSERASCLDEANRRQFLEGLRPGDICRGQVTNLCSFGAFVDLGGLEGLVHISEIAWGRVDHPSEALHPGQEVEVSVLNVDRERGRVGLSIKRTQPDPWRTVEERYHVDEIIEGIITNVVDFGAFAQVEQGVEGLIHVSELAEGNISHPRNVVQEGQKVSLRIISVDGTRRRLGLSLRLAAHRANLPGRGDGGQALFGREDGSPQQP